MAHQQSFMIEIYFYDQNPNGNPHTHTYSHLHIHTLEPDVKPCKLILELPPAVEHLSHVSFHLCTRVLGPFFFCLLILQHDSPGFVLMVTAVVAL